MPVGAQVDCLAFELIDCCEEKMRLPASMLIVATSAEIEGLVKYALLPELVRVRVPLPALVNVAVVLLLRSQGLLTHCRLRPLGQVLSLT